MKKDAPMNLDTLVRALSSRPALPGLTPVSRSNNKRGTAAVIEQMIESLQEQETLVSH